MNPQDLQKLSQLLADEEALVRKELEEVAIRNPAAKNTFMPKVADYGGETDEDDTARKTTDSENNTAIEQTLKQRLDEILKAQEKLKTGVYGVCESCGTNIPVERLMVAPASPYCINCAK